MSELTLLLLVPGLADALEQVSSLPERPRLPGLSSLLARADRGPAPGRDPDEVLLRQFGVNWDDDGDAPIAPLSLLGDGGDPGHDWWLRVDPVHLQPDQDRLLLLGAPLLAIARDEADAFCRLLNDHFRDRHLSFSCLHPQRWYARFPQRPQIRTATLSAVLGRNVNAHLPTGDDARSWRALMNEAQMLLHEAEPNRARAARGEPAVNSVWPWGAGRRPATCASPFRTLGSDSALAQGLARCAGQRAQTPAPDFPAWQQSALAGAHLVELGGFRAARLGDGGAARVSALQEFEAAWAAPLWRALRRGRLQLSLWPGGDDMLVAERRCVWRFWRRSA